MTNIEERVKKAWGKPATNLVFYIPERLVSGRQDLIWMLCMYSILYKPVGDKVRDGLRNTIIQKLKKEGRV